jgi:hypothetical protein
MIELDHSGLSASFFHLAFAALRAISDRSSGVSLSARALPPFSPPRRPRTTAAGFLVSCFLAGTDSSSPVASSMMDFAKRFKSRGRFFLGFDSCALMQIQ